MLRRGKISPVPVGKGLVLPNEDEDSYAQGPSNSMRFKPWRHSYTYTTEDMYKDAHRDIVWDSRNLEMISMLINNRMTENCGETHKEILHCSENEGVRDTYINKDESQNCRSEKKWRICTV